MSNRPIHFELGVVEPERAVKFYEDVFGWKSMKWGGPTPYWLMTTGADEEPGINGGFMVHEDKQPRTVNTIGVDDVDAFAAKVQAAGGQLVVPKMAIPGVGWLAYCMDTEGNLFGIHAQDKSAA
ncbi:MAG: VOC family protein [Candidatus Solibacter usitatus]|nr:VOC family protein [Candidatus Solibacter usitatus]